MGIKNNRIFFGDLGRVTTPALHPEVVWYWQLSVKIYLTKWASSLIHLCQKGVLTLTSTTMMKSTILLGF